MADSHLNLNTYSPSCVVNQCLQQVVGSIDSNPLAQYSACTSMFGAPVISTLTPSADIVFSTSVETVSYTDIVVSVSTTYSTYEAITTVHTETTDVVTQTSSTTTTTTTTATAPTVTVSPVVVPTVTIERRVKKRGSCKTKTSSSSHDLESTVSYPIAGESSSSVPYGQSSASAVPTTSYCTDLAQYSSACACIGAVGMTSVVTAPTPTSTSEVFSTQSVSVPSVSVSVLTIVVTAPVTTIETSTVTATQTTLDVHTDTVTSTYTPTASPHLKISSSASISTIGRYITTHSCNSGNTCLQYDWANTGSSIAANFEFVNGGTWSLRDQPTLKAYNHPTSSGLLSSIYFETDDTATSASDLPLTCSFSDAGAFTCLSTVYNYDTFLNCGAYIYIVPANKASTYVNSNGCYVVELSLST
ncbi:hypothetical protein GGR54DRAFT_634671 [Hypoxylon sp. NC1633]|nr:hypothetical protein GGR54DRAFT_634671 [Hypoxylon sp. NC1633]